MCAFQVQPVRRVRDVPDQRGVERGIACGVTQDELRTMLHRTLIGESQFHRGITEVTGQLMRDPPQISRRAGS